MQVSSSGHLPNRDRSVVFSISVRNMHGFIGIRQNIGRVFAPFDQHNAIPAQIFVKADLEQRFTVENAVQVEVRDLDRRRFVYLPTMR